MAGASNSRKSNKTNNGSSTWNAQIPIDVAPLNSIPPPARAPPTAKANLTPFGGLPAMVFLTSTPTDDEWNNIVDSTKSGVALTGSAAMGKAGPAVGSVDIAESVDEYFFRVSLPGVANDERPFSCDLYPDGKIIIEGVTTTGETTVYKNSMAFKMQTQNLCSSGDFSIAFHLPGPVFNQQLVTTFGSGILEGVVKKRSLGH